MIKHIPIKDLTLLEKNPRKITKEQFEKLVKSLEADPGFFDLRPCLVNRLADAGNALIVYAGNQRVQAAKKLKWKNVPCIVEDDLDEAVMKQRIIKDNSHYGFFDWDILGNEYNIDDLLDAGITPEQMDIEVKDLGSTEEDDTTLEPGKDEDAITKLGDIYELNGHRIGCGDSTDPDFVNRVLSSQEPILMVTDPPYGVEYDPSWRIGKVGITKKIKATGKVKNDDQANWALAYSLFPGSVIYVWHDGKSSTEVSKDIQDSEFEIISQIIWVKQNFAISRGDYHWQHEPCWYAVKKGHKHNWQGARDQSTTWEISNQNAFGNKNDEERTAHSTQKPLECMARPIKNNTAEGEGVYDPFIGSGTTLIAAEFLNRICYGIELSPAYCDIIVNRWKNFMIKNDRKFIVKKNGVEVINE